MAFHTDCGEDNRFMSASRLSDRILYSKKHRKSTEYIDFMHYTADVDQHACANIRMDRTSEQRWYFSENTGFFGLGNVELLYTEGAVLLGMVYNFLPFMILQIQTSLSKMDYSLIEASADLGASPAQTFRRITLPLSMPGVINGITLVFLPAVSSFFIPKLLGGGQYFLIGNMIENQFITVGEWNFGSAVSMIMAIIMMLLMMAVRKVEQHNQGGKGV